MSELTRSAIDLAAQALFEVQLPGYRWSHQSDDIRELYRKRVITVHRTLEAAASLPHKES